MKKCLFLSFTLLLIYSSAFIKPVSLHSNESYKDEKSWDFRGKTGGRLSLNIPFGSISSETANDNMITITTAKYIY